VLLTGFDGNVKGGKRHPDPAKRFGYETAVSGFICA
jgi:hypothetical protein